MLFVDLVSFTAYQGKGVNQMNFIFITKTNCTETKNNCHQY